MQPTDPLFTMPHFIMVLTVIAPFVLFWMDTRRQNHKMHAETQKQNWEMHRENQNRLMALETKLQPVYDWWLRLKGGSMP